LIKTANKRGKLINMAKTNAEISEWEFKDIMRNLKYQLRKDFYTVSQLLNVRQLYKQQLDQLAILLIGMNAQFKTGNIAQKDLLRVQALQISTTQESVDNEKELNNVQAELRTLLQMDNDVTIIPLSDAQDFTEAILSIDNVIDAAKINNATYQLQQLQLKYQQQNLSYQKASAVPDLTLSPNYDRNSNYIKNYTGLGISIPLPIINRNQGNIKSAKWLIQEQETNLQLTDLQLQNDIRKAYDNWLVTMSLNDGAANDFHTSYNKLYDNIIKSYRDRQISLIEFIDYFDTCKEIREKELQLKLSLYLAKEELNYQAGTDVLP
jgi:cobalt-zinc-cadmium efflux system outer membrane protein